MGVGYVRNDTSNNISNGSGIDADDLDGEFNAVESAFNAVTGHDHNGASSNGAPVTKLGPAYDFLASGTDLLPKTDAAYDLGSVSFQFNNGFFADTVTAAAFVGNITGDIAGNADSADVLSTPRTIAVSGQVTGTATAFDGSGNISIPITTLSATNLNAGTVPTARVAGVYSGITGTGALTAGSISSTFGAVDIGSSIFTGNGSGLTNLNASQLSSGTVPNAQVSGDYTGLGNIDGSGTATFIQYQAGDGSATNPSFTFDNDDNSGIYSVSNGIYEFVSNSNPRIRVGTRVDIYGDHVVNGSASITGNLNITGDILVDDITADRVIGNTHEGNGSLLTTLNASQLTSGTVPNARISGTYTGLASIDGSGDSTFARFYSGTGTESAPAFAFEGDTNTGIFQDASNTLSVSTTGTKRLEVNNAGVDITGTLAVNSRRAMVIDNATSNTETSFEIGTILIGSCDDGNRPGSNNVVTVRRDSSTEYTVNEGSGTVLPGTWRARGCVDLDNSVNRTPVLVQRVE
jgi:hypothetical protein